MATYTSALNLKKPAGGENVLIGDINGNMDAIDAEAIRSRANFAGTYDASSSYSVGDYCIYGGNLFRCTTAIGSGGETWTAGHWTQVAVGEELTTLNGKIVNLQNMHSRVLLKEILTPSAYSTYTLNDSVLNYEYIQIIAKKDGKGNFMSTILHKDDVSVGQDDVISLTAYNTSSYNAYIECGFPTNTTFKMPTFRETGWTIKPIYVIGIGKNN